MMTLLVRANYPRHRYTLSIATPQDQHEAESQASELSSVEVSQELLSATFGELSAASM